MSTPEHTTLTLGVLRPADNPHYIHTGLSAIYDELTLVGYYAEEQWEVHHLTEGTTTQHEDIEAPVLLRTKAIYGQTEANLIPAHWDTTSNTWKPDHEWHTSGGNHAHTSDSRYLRLIQNQTGHNYNGALAVYDRTKH